MARASFPCFAKTKGPLASSGPNHAPKGSDSQLRAAFGTAGGKNLAAVHALGTGEKAVLHSAMTFLGLERSFHVVYLLYSVEPQHVVEDPQFRNKTAR